MHGIVVKLHQHTAGGVIAAGAVILELLPVNDELVIEAHVNPSEISHVKEGQRALVRLAALNQRLTPMIEAKTVYLSADAVVAQHAGRGNGALDLPGRPYYVVRVRLDDGDVHQQGRRIPPDAGHAGRRLHQHRRAYVLRLHHAPGAATASRGPSASNSGGGIVPPDCRCAPRGNAAGGADTVGPSVIPELREAQYPGPRAKQGTLALWVPALRFAPAGMTPGVILSRSESR